MGSETLGQLFVLLSSGVALALAFPEWELSLLAWVVLIPLLTMVSRSDPSKGLLFGWLFGISFFTVLLSWLTHTMQMFGRMAFPVAFVVVLLLAGALAGYLALFGFLTAWVCQRLGRRGLILAPFLWVALELGRNYLLTGFPWGLLGYTQYRNIPLIQLAAWTGVYGVSFVIVLVNCILTFGVTSGIRGLGASLACAFGLIGGVFLIGQVRLGSTPRDPSSLPVALVQGSIRQEVKWSKAYQDSTLETYERLTRLAAGSAPHLIVWPETAAPLYLRYEPQALANLLALGRELQTPILVGAPDAEGPAGGLRYYNSAFLLRPSGQWVEKYDKIHLVPFGEYVPLKRILFFVEKMAEGISDFSAGKHTVVFDLSRARFGVVICYEVIFPDLFRRSVQAGADFMVNITNDAWFGRTSGPRQHLAMVPFRAVENGVAVIRAANTGISAIVEPSGRIGPTLGLFERGVLSASIPVRLDRTFYSRYGDLFAGSCFILAVAILGATLWVRRPRVCSESSNGSSVS